MSDEYEKFKQIRDELRAINKIKQQKIQVILDEIYPLIEEVQSRCPHDLKNYRSDRIMGYFENQKCFHCGYEIEGEYTDCSRAILDEGCYDD